MKNIVFLVFLFINQYAHSQGIGIGSTNPPHSSAALDVNSTTKGFLVPRMNSSQRISIASPTRGLQVFDTNTNTFWYHNGTSWQEMVGGGGSFSLPYYGSGTTAQSSSLMGITNSTGGGISGTSNGSGRGVYGLSIGGNGGYFLSFSDTDPALIAKNSGSGDAAEFDGSVKMSESLFINNPSTNSVLSLKGDATNFGSWGQHIVLENATDTFFGAILHDTDGMKFRNFAMNDDFFFRDNSNNTRVRFSATGNIYLDGSVFPNSDFRLKRNIRPISSSLHHLSQLKGYNYYWKEAQTDNNLQTGLIAQEVQAIFPELVNTDEDGMFSVNYIGLIPHLVESVKELAEKTKKIEDLEARLARLEKLLK